MSSLLHLSLDVILKTSSIGIKVKHKEKYNNAEAYYVYIIDTLLNKDPTKFKLTALTGTQDENSLSFIRSLERTLKSRRDYWYIFYLIFMASEPFISPCFVCPMKNENYREKISETLVLRVPSLFRYMPLKLRGNIDIAKYAVYFDNLMYKCLSNELKDNDQMFDIILLGDTLYMDESFVEYVSERLQKLYYDTGDCVIAYIREEHSCPPIIKESKHRYFAPYDTYLKIDF